MTHSSTPIFNKKIIYKFIFKTASWAPPYSLEHFLAMKQDGCHCRMAAWTLEQAWTQTAESWQQKRWKIVSLPTIGQDKHVFPFQMEWPCHHWWNCQICQWNVQAWRHLDLGSVGDHGGSGRRMQRLWYPLELCRIQFWGHRWHILEAQYRQDCWVLNFLKELHWCRACSLHPSDLGTCFCQQPIGRMIGTFIIWCDKNTEKYHQNKKVKSVFINMTKL